MKYPFLGKKSSPQTWENRNPLDWNFLCPWIKKSHSNEQFEAIFEIFGKNMFNSIPHTYLSEAGKNCEITIIGQIIDNDHDDKTYQLAWAYSGSPF